MIIHKIYNFKKWYNTKIKYSDIFIKDLLEIIFEYIYNFIINENEIHLYTDKNSLFKNFCKFIYNQYVLNYKINYIHNEKNTPDDYQENLEILFDYFNCKYSEDIINIYSIIKNITQNYNLSLFHNINDTSFPFSEFIFYNTNLDEQYYDEEIDINQEEYNNYNYF